VASSQRRTRAARLEHVRGIAVDRFGAAADDAARRHTDVLRLENLDTDLRPPAAALETTRAAVGDDANNSYLPFLGQHALRRAAAAHVSRLSGVEYDAESECIVTAGGLSGCLIALLALLDPGDGVIVTDPTYVGMLNRVRLAGGVPVPVPFRWRDGEWRLDLAALHAAVGPRTSAMFIMNPSMPSGAVLNRSEWCAIAELCRAHDLWLIYNAAMERIVYDGHSYLHPAGLPGMAERTLTVGSVSKEFRMIGWRVGWIVGPRAVMAGVALTSVCDVVVPVGIGQPAAAAVLCAADSDIDVACAVTEWSRRRDVIAEELSDLPIRRAAGGWSMLLDVGKMGLTGERAAALLLERAHVAATPMTNWGVVHGPGLVRLVFANEPVNRLRGIGRRVRDALG